MLDDTNAALSWAQKINSKHKHALTYTKYSSLLDLILCTLVTVMASLYKRIEHSCFECPINKCTFYIVISVIAILQYLISPVNFTYWEVSLGGSNADWGSRLWMMQGRQKSSPQRPQSSSQAGKKAASSKGSGCPGESNAYVVGQVQLICGPQGVNMGLHGRKSRYLEKDLGCLPLMKVRPFISPLVWDPLKVKGQSLEDPF